MKNPLLLLLLSTLALSSFQASGMIEAEKSAGKKESAVVDPQEGTREYTQEKETEAFIEESKRIGNPDFSPTGFIERESEKSELESESVEAVPKNELSELEQSAWKTLQPAVLAAHDAFDELLGLDRDEEGNILDSSKQEALRNKILKSFEAYEKQRQAWIAQATSERLAEVATLEEATKAITFTIIKNLDVSTQEHGAVFWTGYTLENQRVAMAYAKEQGKKTIEMTRDGKLLDQLGMYKEDSPIADPLINKNGEFVFNENGEKKCKSKLGDFLFDAASIQFAQRAFGKVTSIIYQPRTSEEQTAYKKSAYARLEEPILKAREEAGESVELGEGRVEVPVEITLPVLKALIKENANKTKGLHLIGTLAHRVAANDFSKEEIENFEKFLNQPSKNKSVSQSIFSSGVIFSATKNNEANLVKKLELAHKAHDKLERKRQAVHALSNFSLHDWKLPFAEEKKEKFGTSHPEENQDEHHEPIAPRRTEQELEALGRVYRFQLQREVEREIGLNIQPVQTEQTEQASSPQKELTKEKDTLSETTESCSEDSSVDESPSLYQELLTWTWKQLEDPQLAQANQARWDKRREVHLLRREADRLARIIDQEKETQAQGQGSILAAPNLKKDLAKTATIFSSLSFLSSTSKGTRSQAVIENKPVTLATLQQEFLEAYQKESVAVSEWLSLAQEKGNAIGIAMSEEDHAMNAWANADDWAMEEQDKRRETLEIERVTEEIKEEWTLLMQRLEKRSQADQAQKQLEELAKQQRELATTKTLSESQRIKEKKELEQEIAKWKRIQQQTINSLETISQKKTSSKKPDQRAEEERALLTRWIQFQEEKDPDRIEEEKTELYRYNLPTILSEQEEQAFTFNSENPSVKTGLQRYEQAARQEALRAAREKIAGAEEAWKKRAQESKKQYNSLEQQLQTATGKQALALNDRRSQLQGISNADEKALKLFEKENNHLNKIEKIWRKMKQDLQEENFRQASQAAEEYHVGNQTSWNQLSLNQQEKYNEKIEQENQSYRQELAAEEAFLERINQELKEEEEKAQQLEQKRAPQFFARVTRTLTESQQNKVVFLKQARAYYEGRLQGLKERQEAWNWGRKKMTHPEEFSKLQEEWISSKKINLYYQRSFAMKLRAIKAKAYGKENEATSWDRAVTSWSQAGAGADWASVYLKNSIDAEETSNGKEATTWREVSKWEQLRYENKTKAALAWEAWAKGDPGKEKEAASWDQAGNRASWASMYLKNSIEAEKAGKSKEAATWREASKWHQLSSENKTKAALTWEAWAKGDAVKEKEATSWDHAGTGANWAGECLKNSIESEKAGKSEEATAWREVSKWQQLLFENKTKAALLWATGDPSKEKEGTSWDQAGNGASWAGTYLKNSLEAEIAGKTEEAATGHEVSKWAQLWCANKTKAALAWEAWSTGDKNKEKEATSWDQAGAGAYSASMCLKNSTEAEKAGKSKEAATWREASKWHQISSENKTKAALTWEAWSKGDASKEKEAASWDQAGSGASSTGAYLKNSIEAEKAGKSEEATAWREASKWQQLYSENKAKAALAWEAWAKGDPSKEKEGTSWDQAGNGASWAGMYLKNSIEAEKAGKSEEATAWREASKWQQLLFENKTKAALLWATGDPSKEKEGTSWDQAGNGASWAGMYLKNSIEAEKAGRDEEAATGHEVSKWAQLWCENATKAALAWEAWSTGDKNKEKEATSWDQAAAGAYPASMYLKNSIEAEKVGKSKEVATWREASKCHQISSENKTKAALTWEAWAKGDASKEKEAASWDQAGNGANSAGAYLKNSIEVEKAGKSEEAASWREASKCHQISSENKTKAALAWEAWAKGDASKEKEAASWDQAGNGANSAGECLKNSIESEKAGKSEEATAWREVSKWQQLRSENRTKAALAWEAWAKGDASKEKEAASWDQAGNGANSAGECLKNSIESEKAGKSEEATAWREVSKWQQLRSENRTKAALAWEAWAKGDASKEKEAASWDQAGNGANSAGAYLKNSIEVEKAGKSEEAASWREASKCHQISSENKTKAALAWEAWVKGDASKEKEAASWDQAGKGADWAAFPLRFAIRANDAGKNEEAAMWHQVSAKNKTASEKWMQSAKAYEAGSAEEGKEHDQEGGIASREAYGLIVSYCSAQESVAQAAGKEGEAAKWHEVLAASQLSIVALDHLKNLSTTQQAQHSWKATQSWREVIESSYFAAHALMQTISKTGEEATTWKTMAQRYQEACNFQIKAAEAYEAGNEADGKRYDKEGEEAFTKVWNWEKY